MAVISSRQPQVSGDVYDPTGIDLVDATLDDLADMLLRIPVMTVTNPITSSGITVPTLSGVLLTVQQADNILQQLALARTLLATAKL